MTIGIITMFYNSSNYGGILQAYALTKLLRNYGLKAEQINYDLHSVFTLKKLIKVKLAKYVRLIFRPRNLNILYLLNKRTKIVTQVAKTLVPNSTKVYTERTICKCLPNYDTFITGSDQVWHGEWPAYFLSFVPSNKKKIAYAVSTGKSKLSEIDIERIKNYSKDFTAISVREADTALSLSTAIPDKKIELVLDPTLLLDEKDWNKIASEKKVKNSYLFCYFLGTDSRIRNLATEYGKTQRLSIVTIPHMQRRIEKNDLKFGDIQSFDATPQDFLSFIKYSDMVFTDSFHASVFSLIFKKQYVVFSRTEHKGIDNRLITLAKMFHTEDRFINHYDKFNLDYIEKIRKIDYSIPSDKYVDLKKKSINFLISSLH